VALRNIDDLFEMLRIRLDSRTVVDALPARELGRPPESINVRP
jgi:hypothetical protein